MTNAQKERALAEIRSQVILDLKVKAEKANISPLFNLDFAPWDYSDQVIFSRNVR